MFYQEDLSTNNINPKQSLSNYNERIQNTSFLQVSIDNTFTCAKTYSLDSSNYSQDSILNLNTASCDSASNNIDFIKYSVKSENQENIDNLVKSDNQINLFNAQILNDKVHELNKKINFMNLHSLNPNPQINYNIVSMIENFDLIIAQINTDIIVKGQLTPKSTKNIDSKKIFEYEL